MAYNEQILPPGKVKIKWEEEYTSDAIAKYNYSSQNFGIAKGFDIQPDGDQTIRLAHDPGDDESVVVVSHESERRGFVIVEPTENVFDLQDWSGSKVHVFAYVNYGTNQDTSVSIRISDTKTGEPWMESTTFIGSVNVPSGGPISNPIEESDIDLYDTEFVGVDSTISGTKWNILNSNSRFKRRYTGYEKLGDQNYFGYNVTDQNIALGTSSSSEGGNTASLRFGDGNLSDGDDVYIRVSGRAQIDADARLVLSTPNNEYLIADDTTLDNGGFSKGLRLQPTNLDSGDIELKVDLSSTSTTIGEFEVSLFEVYTHNFPRKDGTIQSKEQYDLINQSENIDGNLKCAISHEGYSMAFTDMAASSVSLSEWGSYENLPSETNINSILEGLEHGSKGAGVVDIAYPGRVISGLEASINGFQSLNVSSGIVSSDANRKQSRYEFVPSTTGFSVTTDGNTYYLVIDPELSPEDSGYLKQVSAEIDTVEFSGYVPLAWFETSTSGILNLEDARDVLHSESHTEYLSVGVDSGRFSSIHYVCELLNQFNSGDYRWQGSRRIEIVDDIEIDQGEISFPSNCTITADSQREVTVKDIDGVSLFDLAGGTNIKIENINFRGDSTLGSINLFGIRGLIENFEVNNIRTANEGSGSGVVFNRGIVDFGGSISGDFVVRDSHIATQSYAISIAPGTFSDGANLLIDGCRIGSFENFTSVNTLGNHIGITVPLDSNASAKITNCSIGFTSGLSTGLSVHKVQINGVKCHSTIDVFDNCQLSDIYFDLTNTPNSADVSNPLNIQGDRSQLSNIYFDYTNSLNTFVGVDVLGDQNVISNLKMDTRYGTLVRIFGDSNRITGFDFDVDAQNTDPKVNFTPGSKHNELSNGSIRFDSFAQFCIFDTDGNSDNINNRIESVEIHYRDSISAQSLSTENCIRNLKYKTQIKDVTYRIFDGATEDTFLFNDGDYCTVENCRLEVFDGAIFDEGVKSKYSNIEVIVRGVTGTSSSDRRLIALDTAGTDLSNVLFESIEFRETWNPSASTDDGLLSVVPFYFAAGTSGIMVRDCTVEADVNQTNTGNVPFDPQNNSDSANLFVEDFGDSSDGSGDDTLMLETGDKDNSTDGLALWELTALPTS